MLNPGKACLSVLARCGVLCVLVLFAACAPRTGPSPEARAHWETFLATNSAWLDPAPGPLACAFALETIEHDPRNGSFPWCEMGLLKGWCTPEKNLRIVHEYRPMPGAAWRTNEHRYFHGKGGEVSLQPRGPLRNLGLDLWLAGRTGTRFLTPLHLCAAWGLPPDAAARDNGGPTVSLLLTNAARRRPEWHREMMVCPGYGLHPAVFASDTEVLAESVEVTVDRKTWLPLNLIEKSRDGSLLSKITFDSQWLDVGGGKAPREVRCELFPQGYQLTYEFGVEQGVWILKQFTRDCPSAYSLCARATLRDLKTGPVPDAFFPSPADLDLPEHSTTRLGPGERMLAVRTEDGLRLEAKLSLPPRASAPVPVVMFLPGAGPWTFDRPLIYPDFSKPDELPPPMKVSNYLDFYALELAARGIGFFRMNKRGCGIVGDDQGHPREICNRSLFAKATPSVLLRDYQAGLRALRKESGVDSERIVLLGASEGTRLAARLAAAMPEAVRAVVMLGYAGDNTRDTIVWQHTIGPWRNVAKLFDTDSDGQIPRAEYDEAVRLAGKALAQALPFNDLDRNRNGVITPSDMNQRARAEQILTAVKARDDDFLWDNLLRLSSAYLLEDWQSPPLHRTLLQLNSPLAIFHGRDDGACRVECVQETQREFQKAARTNLSVRIYPKTDHDLNWARFLRDGKIPAAFADVFDWIRAQTERAPN